MGTCVIIDYGSGNLHSAQKAFERAAGEAKLKTKIVVSAKPEDVASAERIVLPGVGAFKDCRNGLMKVPGLVEAMREQVISKGKPFLGVCVGMQLMATRGLEHEITPGLGVVLLKEPLLLLHPVRPQVTVVVRGQLPVRSFGHQMSAPLAVIFNSK